MNGFEPENRDRRGDGGKAPDTREGRLKAALQANLARRKAQTRARAADAARSEAEQEKRGDD